MSIPLTDMILSSIFKPQYDYARGARPRWVTATPQTVIGFEDLYITEDAIYGLVWGEEKASMSKSVDSAGS